MSAYRETASVPERVAPVRRWLPDPFAIAVAVALAAAAIVTVGGALDRPIRCDTASLGSDRVHLYVCHPEN
jgi:hypothetical protein